MTRAAAWAARATAPALALVVALTVVSATLMGCGASPTKVGTTGIDELVIPTPSPDPDDFTGNATNAWFPLAPGTRWTYRRESVTSTSTVVAEVLPRPREIAGIATTAVRWRGRAGGRMRTLMVRWYAVDRLGNVWWFGQRVTAHGPPLDHLATSSFQAGRDGAEAGLVLSATPRDGDGYFNALQPRVVARRSTVTSLRGTVSTPTRTFHGTVITSDLSSLAPVHTVQTFFARGVGLVAQADTTSAPTSLALLRVRRP
jgi:hypothetical protein